MTMFIKLDTVAHLRSSSLSHTPELRDASQSLTPFLHALESPAGGLKPLRNLQLYKASLMCYQLASTNTDEIQLLHPHNQLAFAGIGCNQSGNQNAEAHDMCASVV